MDLGCDLSAFGVAVIFLICLLKTFVVLLYVLLLVTTGTAIGLGRQDAEKAIFVTRPSPMERSNGVVLPLSYARCLIGSVLSLLCERSPLWFVSREGR